MNIKQLKDGYMPSHLEIKQLRQNHAPEGTGLTGWER